MVLVLGLVLMGFNAFTQSAVTGQPSFGTGDALKVRPKPEPQNSVTNPIPAAPVAQPLVAPAVRTAPSSSQVMLADQPRDKQEYMRSHPEEFKILPSGEVQPLKKSSSPSTVLMDPPSTKNSDNIADMSKEKKEFVSAHPEHYQVSPEGVVTARGPNGSAANREASVNASSEPKVIYLTAKEFDQVSAEKRAIILQNPGMYKISSDNTITPVRD